MASLEEIQSLLGQVLAAQQTAHQELSEFRSQQIAHNNTTAETMQNINSRLTALEFKSRTSSAAEIAREDVQEEVPLFYPGTGPPITPVSDDNDSVPVLPESPVSTSPELQVSLPAPVPPSRAPLSLVTLELVVQVSATAPISTPVSMNAFLAALSAVAARQAATRCVELPEEDRVIEIYDPGIDGEDFAPARPVKSRQSLQMAEQYTRAALLSYKIHLVHMHDFPSRDNAHAVPEFTSHMEASPICSCYGMNVHKPLRALLSSRRSCSLAKTCWELQTVAAAKGTHRRIRSQRSMARW